MNNEHTKYAFQNVTLPEHQKPTYLQCKITFECIFIQSVSSSEHILFFISTKEGAHAVIRHRYI